MYSLQTELETVKNNLDILTIEFQSIKQENESLKEKIRKSIDTHFTPSSQPVISNDSSIAIELESKIQENIMLQSQLMNMKQVLKQNQQLQDELDVTKSKLSEMDELKQINQLYQSKFSEVKDLKKHVKQLETQLEVSMKKNSQLESLVNKPSTTNHNNNIELMIQQWNNEKLEWNRVLKSKNQIIQSNSALIMRLQSEIESLTLQKTTLHQQQLKNKEVEKYKQREAILLRRLNQSKQLYNKLVEEKSNDNTAMSLHWKHQFQLKCMELESQKEIQAKRYKEWKDQIEWMESQKREENWNVSIVTTTLFYITTTTATTTLFYFHSTTTLFSF